MNRIDFKQVLNIIIIALLIVFVVQNMDDVAVRYMKWTFDIPLIILIVIVFCIGFFTAKIFKRAPEKKEEKKIKEKDGADKLTNES